MWKQIFYGMIFEKSYYYHGVSDVSLRIMFNPSSHSVEYMRQWIGSALFQIMACRLFGAKPLSKLALGFCQLEP